MDSCMCPITGEIFEDPVMGDDGHTYERKAITEWLRKSGTSPMTGKPMSIDSLRTNYTLKKMMEEMKSTSQSQQVQYQFQLGVHVRKTKPRPLFQGFGKSIYEVEWIERQGPAIVLLKIDGAKATREASFYVQLSCHPHIIRTFGLVQCDPGSVMLLQEYAPHGDLSELLRENGFRPTEQVLLMIFQQVCDAMICLADNGIIHGDLACRNVLVFEFDPNEPPKNRVKLTDFGLTRGSTVYSLVDSPSMSTMTIIPIRYVAPEILRNPDRLSYSEKSDVYSMGILMWEACSNGQLPYASIHNESDVRQLKLNDEKLSQPALCSNQLWTAINQCWYQEAARRPTFKLLKELLTNVNRELTNRSTNVGFHRHQIRNNVGYASEKKSEFDENISHLTRSTSLVSLTTEDGFPSGYQPQNFDENISNSSRSTSPVPLTTRGSSHGNRRRSGFSNRGRGGGFRGGYQPQISDENALHIWDPTSSMFSTARGDFSGRGRGGGFRGGYQPQISDENALHIWDPTSPMFSTARGDFSGRGRGGGFRGGYQPQISDENVSHILDPTPPIFSTARGNFSGRGRGVSFRGRPRIGDGFRGGYQPQIFDENASRIWNPTSPMFSTARGDFSGRGRGVSFRGRPRIGGGFRGGYESQNSDENVSHTWRATSPLFPTTEDDFGEGWQEQNSSEDSWD